MLKTAEHSLFQNGLPKLIPAGWKTFVIGVFPVRFVGHRIPVWYCDACGEVIASRVDIDKCPKCGGAVHQDEDALDTWFSSALWPFSTMGWPEKNRFVKAIFTNQCFGDRL